jgi:iron complex outermembrane receptor protein
MYKKIMLLGVLFMTGILQSQNIFKAQIKDVETKIPLMGTNVLVQGTELGATADENGMVVIEDISDGEQTFVFSFIGYKAKIVTYDFPLEDVGVVEIFLEPSGEEMEEIIIASTRARKTIVDLPTRVEVISGEELEEKGNMKPGDIRMLLNETTGIQTQQTSAISSNASIRIQGLDGKYTQLLKDNYPLYSGFSGGLSLLQIVPLDLKQVEVIKGASSTLHGGGAIAGLVNLISKTPGREEEIDLMLNLTSALGYDLSGFYSNSFGKLGTTVFASYNHGTPYDPAGIGLTAIPKFNRYTFNPRLFYAFNEGTSLDIGVNAVVEERTGGNIDFVKGEVVEDPFFERNNTERVTTRAGFNTLLADGSYISIKNSFSFFERKIEIPDFVFAGNQFASFNEATYNFGADDMQWVSGLNLWIDRFDQDEANGSAPVDYNHITYGAFIQNNWKANEQVSLETGLRMDYQNEYGLFFLPRISAMFNLSNSWTARIGGGLGYKTPTVFTEDAERIQFRNVLPIDEENTEAERSIGGNFDVNYRGELWESIGFTANLLFFYTKVDDPLILSNTFSNVFEYIQPEGYIDTKGLEANLKFEYADFKLFTGYTLADVNRHTNGISTQMPLVATHRLNNVLMYEIEEKLKIGLEGYYFSPQKLSDGTTGQQYWIFGLMMEKLWEDFSIFLNFENFTDTRQTRFDSIFTGSVSDPQFRDIYAPVDGFVVNGGIKIRL